MSRTRDQQNAAALVEAMREMSPFQVKLFTATLIGVLQQQFTPKLFAAAISETKELMGYQKSGGNA